MSGWSIHRMSDTPTYHVWEAMKARCLNVNNPRYADYGGRGITLCKEWHNFLTFLSDMGEQPKGFSFDRIDNNKGYYKENCRWTTQTKQMRNTRVTERKDVGVTKIVGNRFRARITVNNKPVDLGCYLNKEDALFARHIGEMIYWGENHV